MNLDKQNEKIKNIIQEMEKITVEMYTGLYDVLDNQDKKTILDIINKDRYVNNFQEEATDQIVNSLVLLAPKAKDLFLMVSTLQIIVDIERIADYAKKMSEYFLINKINSKTVINFSKELIDEIMTDFKKALEAFFNADDSFAFELKEKNYIQKFKHFFELIDKKEHGTFQEMYHIFVLFKSLERAKDHTLNICESTLYYTRGKFYDLG